MSRPARILAAALAAGVLSVPGASLGAPPKIKAIDASSGWKFKPAKTTVVKGTKVIWKSASVVPHEVAFYKGPLKGEKYPLDPGEKFALKLRKAGTYKFRCKISPHSSLSDGVCTGMCGVVKVTK